MRTSGRWAIRMVTALAAIGMELAGVEARAGEPDAAEILQRMDAAISGYEDQAMDVTMTIVDMDGSRKSYDFTILQKGTRLRMIRMLSGELKGMATLVEDRDRVYVYLPGFKKVRRVAAHNMNQTFAGSDFTNDDMAATTWADEYDGVIERQDDANWYVRCTKKPGSKAQHEKALLTIDKRRFYQVGAEYQDASGTAIRRLDGSNLKNFDGAERFATVVMTDLRSGHKTILTIRDFRVDRGLADGLFTTRELEWGK